MKELAVATLVLISVPMFSIVLALKMKPKHKGRHRGRPARIWKELG